MMTYHPVKVKDLRRTKDPGERPKLCDVPDGPGLYEIFAKERDVETLLSSEELNGEYFKKIFTRENIDGKLIYSVEFEGEIYYRVYVGIAVGESLKDRLDRHVNGSARVSTLRRSLAALVSGGRSGEDGTNDFLDRLIVRCTGYSYKVGSREAKEKIGRREKEEMEKTILPLNIRGNRREELSDFTKELKKARSRAKNLRKTKA